MSSYRYKVVTVEAHQLKEFNTTHTVQIPSWVIDLLTGGFVPTGTDSTCWLVKKPDGSFGLYTDKEFQEEFEKAELS